MAVGSAIRLRPETEAEAELAGGGLEQVLLQLAERRAHTDSRFETAIAELRGRLQAAPEDEDPSPPPAGFGPPAHIASLHERVADLARRVRQADRERITDVPGLAAVPGLDEQLNALNAALEASLNEPEPEAQLPAPVQSVSQVAVSPRLGPSELQAIEERLGAIEAALAVARTQSERIGAIENRLTELMKTVEASGAEAKQAAEQTAQQLACQIEEIRLAPDEPGRLDAVQQELKALSQRAGRMDERTLATLEAISGTLQRLMERSHLAEGQAQARRDEKAAAEADAQQQSAELGSDDGWSIDEAPETYEDDGDTAGEACETDPPETPPATRPPMAPGRLASEARQPRRVLVVAAVLLLVASAGLLYGRLKAHGPGLPDSGNQLAPVSPAPADRPGREKRQVSPPSTGGSGEATAGRVRRLPGPIAGAKERLRVRFQELA